MKSASAKEPTVKTLVTSSYVRLVGVLALVLAITMVAGWGKAGY